MSDVWLIREEIAEIRRHLELAEDALTKPENGGLEASAWAFGEIVSAAENAKELALNEVAASSTKPV